MFHVNALMTSPLGVPRGGLQSLLQLNRHSIHVHSDPPLLMIVIWLLCSVIIIWLDKSTSKVRS